jgi:hypothetical protein
VGRMMRTLVSFSNIRISLLHSALITIYII